MTDHKSASAIRDEVAKEKGYESFSEVMGHLLLWNGKITKSSLEEILDEATERYANRVKKIWDELDYFPMSQRPEISAEEVLNKKKPNEYTLRTALYDKETVIEVAEEFHRLNSQGKPLVGSKTPEQFLSRGTGNYINCTDYDDAIEAMKAYAQQEVSKLISASPTGVSDEKIETVLVKIDRYLSANNEYPLPLTTRHKKNLIAIIKAELRSLIFKEGKGKTDAVDFIVWVEKGGYMMNTKEMGDPEYDGYWTKDWVNFIKIEDLYQKFISEHKEEKK